MPAKDEAPRLFVVRLTSLIVASSVRLFFKDAMYSYMFFFSKRRRYFMELTELVDLCVVRWILFLFSNRKLYV